MRPCDDHYGDLGAGAVMSAQVISAAMPLETLTVIATELSKPVKAAKAVFFRLRMLNSSRRFFRACPKVPLRPCARSPATRL